MMTIRTSDIKHLIDVKGTYASLGGNYNSGIQSFKYGTDELIAKEVPYDASQARRFSKFNTTLQKDFNVMGLRHLIPQFIGYFKHPKQNRHFVVMEKATGKTIEALLKENAMTKDKARNIYSKRIHSDLKDIYLKSADPNIPTHFTYLLEDANIGNILMDPKTNQLTYIDFDPKYIIYSEKIKANQTVTERSLRRHPGYKYNIKKLVQQKGERILNNIDAPLPEVAPLTLREILHFNALNRIQNHIEDHLNEVQDL